jgi:hypothetical protein
MASPAMAKLPFDVFVKRALVYPTEDSMENPPPIASSACKSKPLATAVPRLSVN